MEDQNQPKQCASRRTVQMGPISAVDLRCTRGKYLHSHVVAGVNIKAGHGSTRTFGDVVMTAWWPGEWEDE